MLIQKSQSPLARRRKEKKKKKSSRILRGSKTSGLAAARLFAESHENFYIKLVLPGWRER